MKNPMTQFVLAILIVLAISTALFITFSQTYGVYFDLSKSEYIGSFIQSTLGVSISLAGAFVAIKIASLANNIIQHERTREDFSFLNQKIEESVVPIIKVGRTFSLLYFEQARGEEEKNQMITQILEDGNWQQKSETSLGEKLPYLSRISKSLDEFSDALEDVLKSSYAMFVWTQLAASKESKLNKIEIAGMQLSVTEDLGEIIGILRLRAQILEKTAENPLVADVMAARGVASLAKDGKGDKFDHRGVRSFVELGAEIWNLSVNGKMENVGAAILFDISNCFPKSGEDLEENILMLFDSIIDSHFCSHSPLLQVAKKQGTKSWLGGSLHSAITEMRHLEIKLTPSQKSKA